MPRLTEQRLPKGRNEAASSLRDGITTSAVGRPGGLRQAESWGQAQRQRAGSFEIHQVAGGHEDRFYLILRTEYRADGLTGVDQCRAVAPLLADRLPVPDQPGLADAERGQAGQYAQM
jgi:hypothetical protein